MIELNKYILSNCSIATRLGSVYKVIALRSFTLLASCLVLQNQENSKDNPLTTCRIHLGFARRKGTWIFLLLSPTDLPSRICFSFSSQRIIPSLLRDLSYQLFLCSLLLKLFLMFSCITLWKICILH